MRRNAIITLVVASFALAGATFITAATAQTAGAPPATAPSDRLGPPPSPGGPGGPGGPGAEPMSGRELAGIMIQAIGTVVFANIGARYGGNPDVSLGYFGLTMLGWMFILIGEDVKRA